MRKLENIENINSAQNVDEDYFLWRLLHTARDVLTAARRKELSQHNMTPIESSVLFVVETISHNPTAKEISKHLFRKQNTISSQLERMEKKGFLRKMKGNGSHVNIVLTEKGREAHKICIKRESVHKIFSCLSNKERQQLESNLQKLIQTGMNELTLDTEIFLL